MEITRRASRATCSLLVVWLLLGLVVAMAAPAVAEGTAEQKAVAMIRPAIVRLHMTWTGYVNTIETRVPFKVTGQCSGFVVNPNGYVATAGHCLDSGPEGSMHWRALGVAADYWINKGWWSGSRKALEDGAAHWWKVEGATAGSAPTLTTIVHFGVAASGITVAKGLPARVLEYSSLNQGDIGLLKVDATDLPTAQVAPSDDIQEQTSIIAVGYPGITDAATDATYEPTFKDGRISSKRTREGGLFPVFEISAAVAPGMSGGPTVDLDGRVVGVNSLYYPGGQQFNWVSAASLLSEMMTRNGVSNEPGAVDIAHRAGIDAYFAGDYRTALARFDEVLAISQAHKQAQEYRAKAAEKVAAMPPEEPIEPQEPVAAATSPLPIAMIAVVGVVLVGGVLTVRMRRVRRDPRDGAEQVGAIPADAIAQVGNDGSAAFVSAPVGFRVPESTEVSDVTASPVATLVETRRFCEQCGAPAGEGARFCGGCGHTLR